MKQFSKEYSIIERYHEANIPRMHNTVYISKLSLKDSQGENGTKLGGGGLVSNQVRSNLMVLGTVRWEARPFERQPKALKTKLAQGGASSRSPLNSDGSPVGQAGTWTTLPVAKDAQRESWKTTPGSQVTLPKTGIETA
jgi:hypothetical protein